MRSRDWITTGALTLTLGLWSLPASGEAPARLTKVKVSSDAPRAKDGKPDLQGFWNSGTITPLERPRGAPASMSPVEARMRERGIEAFRQRANQPSNPNRPAPPKGGDGSRGAAGNVGGYNAFYIDPGDKMVVINGEVRTSLVVDPPDGRVPSYSADARKRMGSFRGRFRLPTSDASENEVMPGGASDIEVRPLGERCLMSFGSSAGPPALPVLYNNIKQIVQTPDHVMILTEMVHDARIVRMSGTHLPQTIRKWMGDSIGRWEGDTLVIETTNFSSKTRFRGSTENLKVTERLTRVDAKTLLYQFTVEDPNTWDQAWSGEYPWSWSDEPLYEYACHEGNYSLEAMLKGARPRDAAPIVEPKGESAASEVAPAEPEPESAPEEPEGKGK